MTAWRFSCEMREEIPLPPDYSFPQAFNYLNAKGNSFYILEHESGNYIQCGGDKLRCTVEIRIYEDESKYNHFVVGHKNGGTAEESIQMSDGIVKVKAREVLSHWEAIDLFKAFYEGRDIPVEYVLRATEI